MGQDNSKGPQAFKTSRGPPRFWRGEFFALFGMKRRMGPLPNYIQGALRISLSPMGGKLGVRGNHFLQLILYMEVPCKTPILIKAPMQGCTSGVRERYVYECTRNWRNVGLDAGALASRLP